MADGICIAEFGLAPTDEPVDARYERDVYALSQEQARLICTGRFDVVDHENVARGDRIGGPQAIQQARECLARAADSRFHMRQSADFALSQMDPVHRGATSRDR